jgi:hypothetical protein
MRNRQAFKALAEGALSTADDMPREARDLVVDLLVETYGLLETSTRIAEALERVAAALEKTADMGGL